jgi:hypothetical protein
MSLVDLLIVNQLESWLMLKKIGSASNWRLFAIVHQISRLMNLFGNHC